MGATEGQPILAAGVASAPLLTGTLSELLTATTVSPFDPPLLLAPLIGIKTTIDNVIDHPERWGTFDLEIHLNGAPASCRFRRPIR